MERLRGGDQSVLDQLTAALYHELRRIAVRHLRSERPDHTLPTTALVHEAYLRLCGQPQQFADRVHFFSVASRVMRQILVDYARARATRKRGGADLDNRQGMAETVSLEVDVETEIAQVELLDLNRAKRSPQRMNRSRASLR